MELFDPTAAAREPLVDSSGRRVPTMDELIGGLINYVPSVESERALAVLFAVGGRVDSLVAQVLAGEFDGGASDARVDRLAGVGGASKSKRRKTTKRAKAVKQNPDLADKLANGELNDEQTDAIADAADKTDGAAASDEQLISDVEDAPTDKARDIVRKWLNNHEDPNDTETKHQKQRRHRGLKRFETKEGLDAILATGDTESINRVWNQLTKDADAAYKAEGGRDVPAGQHNTTYIHRLFDSFIARIDAESDSDGPPKADNGRPTVFVGATLDPETGDICNAELAGGAPLPQTVLDRLMCNADIIAAAFDTKGEILWQGRKLRTTTAAQHKALIARDGGCVLCGAHYLRCEAHHLMPWNAPGKGQTNIDQMALLCQSCHHWIHDNKLTLERVPPRPPDKRKRTHNRTKTTGPSGRTEKAAPPTTKPRINWHTRPATPNETPPPTQKATITWQTRPATPNETPPPRRTTET